MEHDETDSSWLDNFGYGGITARGLIPRYTNLHEFLGVEADDIPSLPFNSSSWREQLPAFSYQATAENLQMEVFSLACGLRKSPFPPAAAKCLDKRASGDEHRGGASTDSRGALAEVAHEELQANTKVQSASFSSCESEEKAEDEATRMVQDSGGSTTVDVESATTDSSERSTPHHGLRDDRVADDVNEVIVASIGTDNCDDTITGGSSSSQSHVQASSADCSTACDAVVSAEVRQEPEELSRQSGSEEEAETSTKASGEKIAHGRSREEWKCSREDWWDFPHALQSRQVRYLENVQPFTRLLCMKNIKDAHRPDSGSPWLEGRSDDLYEHMGILDPSRSYVAFWMGFGSNNTALFTLEVVDLARLESMWATDCLNLRLKLLLQPVRVSLPFPAKSARDAETIGGFFGAKGSSIRRFRTRCGADVTSMQVDLFSKWLLKMAMTKVGLRENNVLEAIVVDWLPENPAVLSAGRISATEGFIRNFWS